MSLPLLATGDTVTVATYLGDGAYGPSYSPPVSVPCRVEAGRRLVRDAGGDEVVSETRLFLLPTVAGRPAAELFTVESLVAHQGRTAQVITVNSRRGRGAQAVLVEVTTT